jgi:CheY-like chemotaxis protein
MRTNRTVMVTDSYPPIRALMTDVLIGEGYRARCCPEDRVTRAIQREQPDLIILELRRADPNTTLLLLDQIRRHNTTRATPVLVSSTDARLLADLAEPLHQLNCRTLVKPFNIQQLLTQVIEALDSPEEAGDIALNEREYA